MAATHFYIDQERNLLVNGPQDPTPLSNGLSLMQEDSKDIVLHGVKLNPDPNTSLIRMVDDPIAFTTIKLAIGDGPDAPPKQGSVKFRAVGGSHVTPAFAYPIDRAALIVALNALPEVTGLASHAAVALLADSPPNFLLLQWSDVAETLAFEVAENRLRPFSMWRSYVIPQADGQTQLLKFIQAPPAFCENFAFPAPPVLAVAIVRTGTGTRNCVQSIKVPSNAMGTVSFQFATNSTAILSIDVLRGDGSAALAGALNAIYSDSATRFLVTKPSSGIYYVEFSGPLEKTDFPPLVVEMHDQAPLNTPVGSLTLNGPAIEYALLGKPKITLTLELEITNGAKKGTPIQQPVTLLNDMIDSGMSLASDPDWETALVDPIAYPDYDPSSTITGQLFYVLMVGDAVASSFIITHNLGTLNCHVTVRSNGNGNHRVPDDHYTTTYLDQNRIQIDFAAANFEWERVPNADEFVVIISGANSSTVAFPHHHAIGDIDELQDILDTLRAGGNPLELWPSIPESKLPNHIGWHTAAGDLRFDPLPSDLLAPETAVLDADRSKGGRLLVSELPFGTPYYDPATGNVLVDLPGPPPSQIVLLDNTGRIPVGTLPSDPSAWPGLSEAIIKALQAGATLPAGYIPMLIDPIKASFPLPYKSGDTTVPASLPRALPGFATGGLINGAVATSVSGALPLPSETLKNKVWTVAGGASSLPVRWRAAQIFDDGVKLGCDGQQWFEVVTEDGNAFPREMERDLFTVRISPEMMQPGSRFACTGVLYVSLTGPAAATTRGQYKLRLEIGALAGPLLNDITFTTVFDKLVLLSSASVGHSFGYSLTLPRPVAGVQGPPVARTTMYDTETVIEAPATLSFVLRASLCRFDLEDVTGDSKAAAPVGQVNIELKNALGSVARLP